MKKFKILFVCMLMFSFSNGLFAQQNTESKSEENKSTKGTAGYILKKKTSTTTENSNIYQTSTGNIGIGTTSPSEKLTLDGNLKFSTSGNIIGNKSNGTFTIYGATPGNNGAFLSLCGNNNPSIPGEVWLSAGKNTTGSVAIRAGGVTRLDVRSNGDVVLGDPNRTGRFLVNGKIEANEIKVSTSQWWDCVFEDDYQLMSLKDVESFVKEYKHLPEVPTEEEVIENGVNVGDMNGILLKKIEELTLHMIELKKENEELRKMILNSK